jgi:hypothetical protein
MRERKNLERKVEELLAISAVIRIKVAEYHFRQMQRYDNNKRYHDRVSHNYGRYFPGGKYGN